MGQLICPPSQSARDTAADIAPPSNNTMSGGGHVAAATAASHKVLVDYQNGEYKGFVFVIHQQHGLMLLYCTRKKKKPPHWQLAGGKIDEHEFIKAGKRELRMNGLKNESHHVMICIS
jgi:hypothetical protein